MVRCGAGCAVKPDGRAGFWARGGAWVLGQIPVLLGAVLVPTYSSVSFGAFAAVAPATGLALTVAGGIVALVGALQLGSALTPLPYPRDGAHLHRGGIYRFLRHPIYSGLIVGSLGWALAWQSLWGLGYVVLVFAFFDRKAAREEQWLRVRYPGYDAYAQRVKRFLPGVY